METIVLDWSALSQVVQKGETGALEQALRSTGAKLAITDHGVVDIPKAFSADFSKDTKENRRTGSDWLQGGYDEDGYGPRMTLSYDDEAGERRVVTESFQANVDRAWQRSRMTHMARLRKKA
ncbi:hypothetical protein, partial [Labrenzia sp. DG1229]|uniref:hypothetical protein n=1 Tax=Labrenzia sp. DG1229 TaxID=681847 RepID=UPI000568F3E7